jgi:hypothetical protein
MPVSELTRKTSGSLQFTYCASELVSELEPESEVGSLSEFFSASCTAFGVEAVHLSIASDRKASRNAPLRSSR